MNMVDLCSADSIVCPKVGQGGRASQTSCRPATFVGQLFNLLYCMSVHNAPYSTCHASYASHARLWLPCAQVRALEGELALEAAAHTAAREAAARAHTVAITQLREELEQAR